MDDGKKEQLPKHVAITVEEPVSASLKDIIFSAGKLGIPILTFHLPAGDNDWLVSLFNELAGWKFLHENQYKVSILGKWYSLPSRVVEPIKKLLADTKDYDRVFLNFCINYDGQEEIVDACRLIAKQVKLGRLDPEGIDMALIKENIYSSYFLPPSLIIKTGSEKKLNGFLLWDSTNSKIFFSGKSWKDFTDKDFHNAIEWWKKN